MGEIFYFSSGSENTARFVSALGLEASRIPVRSDAEVPRPNGPFVLICPTYADGEGRRAVPPQVISFLNDPEVRGHLKGVIGAGNRNFGATFCQAARVISAKCQVPVLYRFELAGSELDVSRVREGLMQFWLSIEPDCPEPPSL